MSCKVGAEGEEGGLVEDMNEKFNFFLKKKATFKNKKKNIVQKLKGGKMTKRMETNKKKNLLLSFHFLPFFFLFTF